MLSGLNSTLVERVGGIQKRLGTLDKRLKAGSGSSCLDGAGDAVSRSEPTEDLRGLYETVGAMWAESMDRSVDPCVDFYRHACGKMDEATLERWRLQRLKDFNQPLLELARASVGDGDPFHRRLMAAVMQQCTSLDDLDPSEAASVLAKAAAVASVEGDSVQLIRGQLTLAFELGLPAQTLVSWSLAPDTSHRDRHQKTVSFHASLPQ
jgi:hypothetical protein